MSQQQNEPTDRDLQLFQFLATRRHTIEKVFWSRIQTLHAIQAGVLAGGFAFLNAGHYVFSSITFFFGILLTGMLGQLAQNDWNDASANDGRLNCLFDRFDLRRVGDRPSCTLLRSHLMLFFTIVVFVLVDLILALLSLILKEGFLR